MIRYEDEPEGSRGPDPTPPVRRKVEYYEYPGDDTVPTLRKWRLEPKAFFWERLEKLALKRGKQPTGQFRQVWTRLERGSGIRPNSLYRIADARQLVEEGWYAQIYVLDGEKDVNRAFAEERAATCGHAGATVWLEWMTESLHEFGEIVIVADRDEDPKKDPGKGYWAAREIRRKLAEDRSDRVISIVRAAAGKDLSDHFDQGYRWDDLEPVSEEELASWSEKFEKAKQRAKVAIPEIEGVSPELAALADSLSKWLAEDPERLTSLDIAEKVFELLNGLAFLARSREYRCWNGNFYEEFGPSLRSEVLPAVVKVARAVALAAARKAVDEKGKPTPAAKKYRERDYAFSHAGFTRELLFHLESFGNVDDGRFDKDSSIIACESGVLDRDAAKPENGGTIQWQEHEPPYPFITKSIPFSYDPTAEAPEWRAFLASSIPDGGKRLQVLLGFALAGDDTKKKRVVNLIGERDTGKSTCLDMLSRVLGAYLGTMRTEEIIVSRRNAKFDFHGLRGSRMVFLAEPDPRSRFRVSELKQITAGEETTTEGKGTQPVRWRASVMPFIGTNFHINFDTTDDAFNERLEYVEFARTRGIDRELKKKLIAELPGIFRWVMDGVRSYFAGELEDTEESLAARRRAQSAVEPPLQFIELGLAAGNIHEVPEDFPAYKCCPVDRLYQRYCEWWHEEEPDIKPYGRKRFSSVIQHRYPQNEGRSGGRKTFSRLAFGPPE